MTRRSFLRVCAASIVSAAVSILLPASLTSRLSTRLIPVPHSGTAMAEAKTLNIAVLSDLHIHSMRKGHFAVEYNRKAELAVLDMLAQDPDVFIVLGDIANSGLPDEYALAKQILKPVRDAKIPILVTMGNHEFYNTSLSDAQIRALFCREFSLKQVYNSTVIQGVHFVTLSPEYRSGAGRARDWAYLTGEQLVWFDKVLTENAQKPTFVFLHQPLNDTVEQSQYVDWIARTAQTDQLLAIARRHPQILCWFSGHTHAPLQQAGQMVSKNGILFVGGASTFYTNEIARHTSRFLGKRFTHQLDFRANQNRFVVVSNDQIRVRARDHLNQRWMTELDRVLKHDSNIQIPVTPESV